MGLQAGCCELQRDAHFDPLRLPLLAGLCTLTICWCLIDWLVGWSKVVVYREPVIYPLVGVISWAFFICHRQAKDYTMEIYAVHGIQCNVC